VPAFRLGPRLQLYDAVYLAIGLVLCLAVPFRSGGLTATLSVAACTAAYAIFLGQSHPGSRPRLAAAYLATWALYAGSSHLIEVMRIPLQSARLLAWDKSLFGQSPALLPNGNLAVWQWEVLALAYLSYHVYLQWALLDALSRDADWRADLSDWLFLAFGAGFIGYLVFPAAGPMSAFPDVCKPLPATGLFSALNNGINATLGARYDAFPSLHTLITLTLLAWDWRRLRVRFWIMIVPSLLMLASTLILRLHYAADLIASGVIFVLLMGIHAGLAHKKA